MSHIGNYVSKYILLGKLVQSELVTLLVKQALEGFQMHRWRWRQEFGAWLRCGSTVLLILRELLNKMFNS